MQKFWEIYKQLVGFMAIVVAGLAALMGYLYILIEVLSFWWSMVVVLGVTPAIMAAVMAYIGRDYE